MIEYVIQARDGAQRKFGVSYSELRELYRTICAMTDAEFIERLPMVMHTACVISWFKGLGSHALDDIGVVHELAHLAHIPDDTRIETVRDAFRVQCELA